MTTRRFAFWFTVSREFERDDTSGPWIDAQMASIARKVSARGPRGGLYRLDPAEPLVWLRSDDGYPDFQMNQARYETKRRGTYVPPSRVTPDLLLKSNTFVAIEVPVRDGVALLPDGAHVATAAARVLVPVPA